MKKFKLTPFKILLGGVLLLSFWVWFSQLTEDQTKIKPYTEFNELVMDNKVDEVAINLGEPTFTFTVGDDTYRTDNPKDATFKKDLLQAGVKVVEEEKTNSGLFTQLLFTTFQVVIILVAFRFILGSTGKSKSIKEHKKTDTVPSVTFADVAGQAEAKEEMMYLVDFLKNSEKYTERGAALPKGAIFYGPPGTGKTLLAKAIAGEAQVPFFSANGSDFMEMYVGVGAKRVRALFEEARKKAPCIVFIDEIDSVGGSRTGMGNGEQQQTINALLNEMDGFSGGEGIIVIAATNRIQDLDAALIRPGRFDKHMAITLPDQTDRHSILNVHAANKTFEPDVDFMEWSRITTGFSGADLEALLNEATILSVINQHDAITKDDLDDALYKRIMQGHEKKNQSDRHQSELDVVAWHEAGHAVIAKLVQKNEVPKVTILSSTNGAGGVTFMTPGKRNPLPSKTDMENRVKVLYAGRVAEYLLLGDEQAITTGASSDIQEATKVIRAMVNDFGMSDEVGMLNLSVLNGGDVLPRVLLAEAQKISKALYEETLVFLRAHKPVLKAVAEGLLEKETLDEKELDAILATFHPVLVEEDTQLVS